MPSVDDRTFWFEGFALDLDRGCLLGEDGEIELRPKSFEVLCYLIEHAGRLVRKDKIMKAVWPNVVVSDASLAQCVSEVRLALRDNQQQIIRTVARRGYLFAAPVSRSAPAGAMARLPADAGDGVRVADNARADVAAMDAPVDGSSEREPVAERRPAERRQITVLACEWIGLAAMAARSDPEDLRVTRAAYRRHCIEIVSRHGGHVSCIFDDGVLVYFGYPAAGEHDAEDAVRAGLALLGSDRFAATPGDDLASEGLPGEGATVSQSPPFPLRIGIASGMVVIDDDIGDTTRQPGAVGAAPFLARSLQAMAKADSLLIDQNTRRLAGGWFEYDRINPIFVDGHPKAVEAWRVLGASRVAGRFEALRAGDPAALVGRDEEIELLLRRWQRATDGDGQVMLVSGEAGIGKSRLAAALLDRLAGTPHASQHYFCSPHHSDSALYPILQQIERAAALAPGDDDTTRGEKLDVLLAQSLTPPEDRAALAELLSSARPQRPPTPDLPPQHRRRRTFEALTRRIEAKAQAQPVVVIFEDVQWIDPTSLEVLNRMVERTPALPVLLVVTFRPEFIAPWIGEPHVSLLTLRRLAQRDCHALVEQIAGANELADDLIDEIVARSDGVPLFAEELTKAVIEANALAMTPAASGDEAEAAPTKRYATGNAVVPLTLHASLMARLDRLGPAREVAQIGAAIGREFSGALVAAVVGCSEAELHESLDRLTDSGLVRRDGGALDATFVFKHALVQDAAYGTLLRDARRDLHARIAIALERDFPYVKDSHPEILARHYDEAELLPLATTWWGKAGDLALRRPAFDEAVAHLGRAIEAADSIPPDAEPAISPSARLKLQVAYAQALMWARGHGNAAPETIAAFARARELMAGVEDGSERFFTFYGLWAGSMSRGEIASARDQAEAYLSAAEREPGAPQAAVAHAVAGVTSWHQGDFVGARAHLEQAQAIYRAAPAGSDHLFRFGQDVEAHIVIWLALVLWPLGEPDRAGRFANDVLARAAAESGPVPTTVYVHQHKLNLEMIRRDAACAKSHAETVIRLCRQHGLTASRSYAGIHRLWTRWRLGEARDVAAMRNAIDELRERRIRQSLPWCLTLLAEMEADLETDTGADARADMSEIEVALGSVDAALAEAQQTGEHWYDSESHRMRGNILLARDPADSAAAEQAFRAAIAVAQQQQAHSFVLRAALALAEFYAASGRGAEADGVLAAPLARLSANRELPEVEKAQQLLAGLTDAAGNRAPVRRRSKRPRS
jgi:DNA-binding winged helix-turn-helix (wHTH) protein/tetratricopeptide (TPR) repeat protein